MKYDLNICGYLPLIPNKHLNNEHVNNHFTTMNYIKDPVNQANIQVSRIFFGLLTVVRTLEILRCIIDIGLVEDS